MTAPARKLATYADIEAVPPHLVAEIIYGVLETHPRPAGRHGTAAVELGFELVGPFRRGRGGPGGWRFVVEPELHLDGNVVVPDIAGWRKERLLHLPATAYFEIAPDWVCEILSPSTTRLDRGPKRAIYGAAGVAFLWLLDPVERVLEAFQLVSRKWELVGVATGDDQVKLPPFDAISFPLAELFPFDPPPSTDATPQG